ncbi:spermatogenesis-associated protein 5-like protein 1 [Kappamyces sp. JEL0680]|nr:spermatogenesis-associated protein 5-like protein 1 [Kappamyces sp. JEL0680]
MNFTHKSLVSGFDSEWAMGQWALILTPEKAYHNRIWPVQGNYHRRELLLPGAAISRPLSAAESSLALVGSLIRPWTTKLPVAITVRVTCAATIDSSDVELLQRLSLGFVLRAECTVALQGLPAVVVQDVETEPGSNSHDAVVGHKTVFVVLETPTPETHRAVCEPRGFPAEPLDAAARLLFEVILYLTNYKKSLRTLGIDVPKGILLHGPPGVGKTFLVGKIAALCSVDLFVLNRGDLAGSRAAGLQALRKVFFRASRSQSLKPCIVFIDELDSIAPSRLLYPDDSSMVAQLLTLMDGLDSRGDVVVVGATNRPNALDAALRRPGRCDAGLAHMVDSTARSSSRFPPRQRGCSLSSR